MGTIREVASSKGLAFDCLHPVTWLSLQPNDGWGWHWNFSILKTLADAHREECSFLGCFTLRKTYLHFQLGCLPVTELLTCRQVELRKLSSKSGKMTATHKTWEEPQRTLRKFNRTVFLLLLQSVSMCGGALFMILINKSHSFSQALFCMMMAMGLNALGNSGVAVTPQDMSPKFAGTLFGKVAILLTCLELRCGTLIIDHWYSVCCWF